MPALVIFIFKKRHISIYLAPIIWLLGDQ